MDETKSTISQEETTDKQDKKQFDWLKEYQWQIELKLSSLI